MQQSHAEYLHEHFRTIGVDSIDNNRLALVKRATALQTNQQHVID